MVYFDLDFLTDYLVTGLLCIAALAALWIALPYCLRIASIRRFARLHNAHQAAGAAEDDSEEAAVEGIPAELPDLSVIVYSKDSSAGLARLLPQLLEQDYPGRFEVIVTNDGQSTHAEGVVTLLSAKYRNLRMTYVPDEAHALSRPKLAMTLGVKAARYDYVLMTNANVVAPSKSWLALMARHFAEGKEVVIGVCDPVGPEGAPEKPMAAFNTLADTATYLVAAIAGKPYRGNAFNMAFLRRKFFDNHGFAKAVGFHHGIDDIFLSQIADGDNTAVEITPQAIAELECHDVRVHHLISKMQHLFTGKHVSRGSRRFFGFGSLMAWVWLAATVGAGVLSFPNLLPLCISVGIGIAWMIVAAVTWRRCGRALGIKAGVGFLAVRMFARPISNMIYKLRSRSSKSSNYTWAKGY